MGDKPRWLNFFTLWPAMVLIGAGIGEYIIQGAGIYILYIIVGVIGAIAWWITN